MLKKLVNPLLKVYENIDLLEWAISIFYAVIRSGKRFPCQNVAPVT